jgi:E3 ubiquitin ligase SMURF1/2
MISNKPRPRPILSISYWRQQLGGYWSTFIAIKRCHKVLAFEMSELEATSDQQRRMKLRLTVHSAKNLNKKELFKLPDPFAKVIVEGSGQCHFTEPVKATLDPKWNQHYDLFLSRHDSITISVWNSRKVHKRQGAGFLGCVRLNPSNISRLRDTGCTSDINVSINHHLLLDQRLNLAKNLPDDDEAVRGQLIVSLTTREPSQVIPSPLIPLFMELPEGWERRKTPQGHEYYYNIYTKTTQWNKPTRPGFEMVQPANGLPANSTHDNGTQSSIVAVARPSSAIIEQTYPSLDHPNHPIIISQALSSSSNTTGPPPPISNRASDGYSMDSARQQNYLRRNTLHHELQLPDGYGN